MDSDARMQTILDLLGALGSVTNTELSERFNVSEMTIRRDLTQLEADGLLTRTHGGAVRGPSSSFEPPFAMRARLNVEAKRAIAASVAELVQDGQTVVLDGGTTGQAIAEVLVGRQITVCALNLRVAEILTASPVTKVMVPGGFIRHNELSFTGPAAEQTLRDHRFDTYVMTVSGLSNTAGLTEWTVEDAAVKRAALASSASCIVACDSSKFGQTAFARIAPISAVDVVVTDADLSSDHRQSLGATGTDLRFA